MDVARHREVSSGIDEFHMAFTVLHTITDGTSAHANNILAFLGGSDPPGGPPRTDGELLRILEVDWSLRWGKRRVAFEIVTPCAEAPATALQAPGRCFEDRFHECPTAGYRMFLPFEPDIC
jgi:hypothetical protein